MPDDANDISQKTFKVMGFEVGLYTAVLTLGLLLAVAASYAGGVVVFVPIDGNDVYELLVPLFLIALFIERAVEVLVGSWRGFEREAIESALERAKDAKDEDEIKRLDEGLRAFRTETRRCSFLFSAGLALLICIFGVRTLEHLTDIELAADLWRQKAEAQGYQVLGFRLVDIVLTSGLLAGGADGIHKVLSLFLDFIDTSRGRLKNSARPATE